MALIVLQPYRITASFQWESTAFPNAYGLFPGSSGVSSKYVFSTHSVSTSTTLGANRYYSTSYGSSTTAYVFGGGNSGAGSLMLALAQYNYSNGAVDNSVSITNAGYHMNSISNSTFGIIAQPVSAPLTTDSIRKHTYSGNIIVTSSKVLDYGVYQRMAFGCDVQGYFYGGASIVATANLCRYTYANDTVSYVYNTLRAGQPSTSNSMTAGNNQYAYIYTNNAGTSVQKYDYSTETLTSASLALGTGTFMLQATENDVYAVFNIGPSTVKRLVFASEAITSGTVLNNNGNQYTKATSGYHSGLQTSSFTPFTTTLASLISTGLGLIAESSANKKLYNIASDSIIANGTGMLASTRQKYLVGTAGNASYAFLSGRATNGGTAQVNYNDLYTYASDSFAISTNLSSPTSHSCGAGNATNGYIFAGNNGADINTIKRYAYATSTYTVLSAVLVRASRHGTAAGNTTIAVMADGYNMSGTTEKFTYSSETAAAGTSLSSDYGKQSFSSSTAVLFVGGAVSPATATQRYTIATNTVVSATACSAGHALGASFGNGSTSGYVAGGGYALGKVDKYDWAAGTWTSTVTANIVDQNGIQGGTSTVHAGL